MLAPPTIASQTDNPSSPSRIEGGASKRSELAGDARSRFERTVFYPAHVCPIRRSGEATAPARGVNRAMTRSSLSDAPRRADGLATSAVLNQVVQLPIARDPKETARR